MRLEKKTTATLLIAIFMISVLAILPVNAYEPHTFSGDVTVGEYPALDGTPVEAKIEDTLYASTTTTGGEYVLSVTASDGAIISFYVKGFFVTTYPYTSSENTDLDLSGILGALTVITNDERGVPINGEVFVDDVSWGIAPQTRTVEAGFYKVSFGPIDGYTTPDPVNNVEVKGCLPTVVPREYVWISTGETGILSVTTTPVSGTVRLDGAWWGTAPVSKILDVKPYPYTVSFDPVAGYDRPALQEAFVIAGETTEIVGIYTKIPVNLPPVADADGPYSGLVGTSISFDGSGSTDSDGTIEIYTWDFGDDTTGTGVNPSHKYDAVGTYIATLTVTDNDGATDIDTAMVTVVQDITVSTDKPSYVADELVTISGVAYADALVAIDVKNPLATSIYVDTVPADVWGAYDSMFSLPVDAMTGTYTVYVSVPGATASTTFHVLPPIPMFVFGTVYIDTAGVIEPASAGLGVYAKTDGTILDECLTTADGMYALSIDGPAEGTLIDLWVKAENVMTITLSYMKVLEQDLTYTGATPDTGTLYINTEPFGGQVFVEEESWGMSPQTRVVYVGVYTVSFGDVPGYTTPADQVVIVTAGLTTDVMGTYVLEPTPSAKVDLTATVVEPVMVSISVSPTSIDFGPVAHGGFSAPQHVTITSTSDVNIDVTADLSDGSDLFFTSCLMINGAVPIPWPSSEVGTDVEPGEFFDVSLGLDLRFWDTLGSYSGTLVFWAQES